MAKWDIPNKEDLIIDNQIKERLEVKNKSYSDLIKERKAQALEKLELKQIENDILKEEIFSMKLEAVKEGNLDYASLFDNQEPKIDIEEIKQEIREEFEEAQKVQQEAFNKGFEQAQMILSQQSQEVEEEFNPEKMFMGIITEKLKGGINNVQSRNNGVEDSSERTTGPKQSTEAIVRSNIQRIKGNEESTEKGNEQDLTKKEETKDDN